ncbi:MAG: hypothetical protein ABIJ27_02455 [Candidatus Omnitrophota bacterium]
MRRYRTVIEVMTEAEDQHEAADIAGEYLRGNISSGVSMKCSTRPAYKFSRVLSSLIMLF